MNRARRIKDCTWGSYVWGSGGWGSSARNRGRWRTLIMDDSGRSLGWDDGRRGRVVRDHHDQGIFVRIMVCDEAFYKMIR